MKRKKKERERNFKVRASALRLGLHGLGGEPAQGGAAQLPVVAAGGQLHPGQPRQVSQQDDLEDGRKKKGEVGGVLHREQWGEGERRLAEEVDREKGNSWAEG